jgi:hypothetical protein
MQSGIRLYSQVTHRNQCFQNEVLIVSTKMRDMRKYVLLNIKGEIYYGYMEI